MKLRSCAKGLGADVDMVRRGIGSDERIGRTIFISGYWLWWKLFSKRCTGIGQIIATKWIMTFKILDAVMDVNEKQKLHLVT